MKYSEGIKVLRKKMILSQMEFAELLDVAFSTVNRWEAGEFAPTIKAKRKLMPLFEKYNIVLEEKEDVR